MQCMALVNLPDWPEGTLRDVDPKDEIVQGFLRAAFVVPMVRRSRAPQAPESPKPPATKRENAG